MQEEQQPSMVPKTKSLLTCLLVLAGLIVIEAILFQQPGHAPTRLGVLGGMVATFVGYPFYIRAADGKQWWWYGPAIVAFITAMVLFMAASRTGR